MDIICELKDINKSYGNKKILENFSLSIHKNEFIAITGQSGSGKTTLLNLIGLLEKQDNGQITLFDEENAFSNPRLVRSFLRNKISYLFQNYALIDNESIEKNLEIPLIHSRHSKKQKTLLKEQALSEVGLTNSLKQKVYELSGGEQQRLAIARLLLKPCDLILADEPTGSLDVKNRDEILQLLADLNKKGKTIVVVTHDVEVAEKCSRIIKIS